jgi:hypothetical protein
MFKDPEVDFGFARGKPEEWEISDGCVFIIREIA